MKILLLALLLFPAQASAHTTIVANEFLAPRSTNPGLKRPPCGNVARSPSPARLSPGAKIRLDWIETIQHPGRFEIYFSPARDRDFTLLKTIEDGQDGEDDLPHRYSTELTLPDLRCDDCTLQLIQVMTENPQRPRNYYSCADLVLSAP